MNPTAKPDRFDSELNLEGDRLFIEATGIDRPNLIAAVTNRLDASGVYIARMTYNLKLSAESEESLTQIPYQMEILAQGNPEGLKKVHAAIKTNAFFEEEDPSERRLPMISWTTSHHFHLIVNTPDQPGLTARISQIVGKPRNSKQRMVDGSFIHLIATTLNDGGPQGGTPFFQMRANVAVEENEVMEAIIGDLMQYANDQGIERDLKAIVLS